MTPPEFILLTGFLGSGKTSLLRDWLALPEAADTALIVNEAGEIDVDGAILAEAGGVPMAMLANGCVCCSLTSDLVFTIRALLEERERSGQAPFRRIVLESSGLSRPGPILRSLLPLAPLGLRVRVVATCDAAQAEERAAHFDEAAAQLAAAGVVVFTKLDLAGTGAAEATVAGINPTAVRVIEPDRAERARRVFLDGAEQPWTGLADSAATGTAHPRIGVMRLSFAETASWDDRLDAMEDLAAFLGDRLLRVKGFLRRPGTEVPLLVQAVGTLFSPPVPLPGAARATEGLVVIARDMTAAALRAGLSPAPVHVAAYRGTALACDPG